MLPAPPRAAGSDAQIRSSAMSARLQALGLVHRRRLGVRQEINQRFCRNRLLGHIRGRKRIAAAERARGTRRLCHRRRRPRRRGERRTRPRAGLRAGAEVVLHATADARIVLIGGAPTDGERHIWSSFPAPMRESSRPNATGRRAGSRKCRGTRSNRYHFQNETETRSPRQCVLSTIEIRRTMYALWQNRSSGTRGVTISLG